MLNQGKAIVWMGLCLLLGFSSTPALADCLELKNDTFDAKQKPQVVAIRSFCISENFGAIFTAPQDITVQKIRLLISGNGKDIMEQTTLKLSIYKEVASGGVNPGKVLIKESPYNPPNSINKPTPQWLEIEDNTTFKKGERFRIVFSHDTIDCELRAGNKPLCADACSWWSATADTSPTKPKTNVAFGRMFKCPSIDKFAWRFWEDLPAGCKPTGNLIIRVFAATSSGKDCKGGGVGPGPGTCTAGATQACTCTDGKSGSQTCTATGSWAPCQCSGPSGCTAGAVQACVCTDGKSGTQTCAATKTWAPCQCKSDNKACTPGDSKECTCTNGNKGAQTCAATGQAWEACKCEAVSVSPTIAKVTPGQGPINQNVNIGIEGTNFVKGAKVTVGSILCNDVNVRSGDFISAVIPAAIKAGTYDVSVENPDGKRATLKNAYTVEGGCACSATGGRPARIPVETLLLLGFALLLLQERKRA